MLVTDKFDPMEITDKNDHLLVADKKVYLGCGDGDGAGVATDATWPVAGRQGAIGTYGARWKGERSLGGGVAARGIPNAL